MSRQPEPPASIAKALIDGMLSYPDLPDTTWAIKVADAVWDALLAEGELCEQDPTGACSLPEGMAERQCDFRRVLVIPLPVVEPRDTEQA